MDIKYNKEGSQISFECAGCGKVFYLEDMRYIYPQGDRLCPKCFKRFKSLTNKERMEHEEQDS